MDHLDVLKKDWKKQEQTLPKISKEALTKVIHKKSSSIVKWIFIISVLELLVPLAISFLTGNMGSNGEIEKLGLVNFINGFYIFYYIVILLFIYKFYKNYTSITATASSKLLMQNILKTRKVVKYYIWFHFSLVPVITIVLLYKTLQSPTFLAKNLDDVTTLIIWLLSIVIIGVVILFLWLFYRLIYGILLNKLNRNYKELVDKEN